MGVEAKTRLILTMVGRFLNEFLSFVVFTSLDLLDFVLCYAYRVADFLAENHWKPCYCSSPPAAISGGAANILLSERGESRIVRLTSTKIELEQISDTLYARPSLLSDLTTSSLRRREAHSRPSPAAFSLSPTVVEMLRDRIGRKQKVPVPRWSDCDCTTCTAWTHHPSSPMESLFVKAHGAKENVQEDVLFIHGFISSSAFWTETLYPNFSDAARSRYRFLAVDLLGFGRSPKPAESLYTLWEHLEMIEKSVMEPYKVGKFHIVAHSLGCILAVALAGKYPAAVKSLTLLAPPYFPAPKGEEATQYMMRRVAPRRVWPLIAFGASIACWYEHISRTVCLVICKNHRIWQFLAKLITRNRMRTYLMEGFFLHTHNAAWHTLHNIICGTAGKMEGYLDQVNSRLKCDVTIIHGNDDDLIPVECSYNVQSKISRAKVKVVKNKDHITIVVGRQRAFALELEGIWKNAGR